MVWHSTEGRASLLSRHWHHHSRFYIALALALIAYAVASFLSLPVPPAIAGDVFFVVYLAICLALTLRLSPEDLDKRADVQDEGLIVVFLITIVAIAFACVGVFKGLNQHRAEDILPLVITLAGAPLGWFMLHALMAFHYANIFYFGSAEYRKTQKALEFPGNSEPDMQDFLYFSFVLGMTAQVSDVQVLTTRMRRTTLIHSLLSFFFNTVLIAMVVNAVVSLAD